jgi:lysophospholipase L1-like esterase
MRGESDAGPAPPEEPEINMTSVPDRRLSPDTIRPGRKVAFVLVMLAGIAVLFLGVEGVGRLYINLVYGVPGKSYGIYRADFELGARHAENTYNLMREFNDHGFQSPEDVMELKPEGAARVLVYGDTTVFSPNLEMEDTWPLALQDVLREDHHPRTQVLNAGEDNWSIGHAFTRARTEIEVLAPDVAIIYAGIAFAQSAEPDPLVLAHYQKVLADFIELNTRHGAATVFVIQAHGAGTAEHLRLTGYSRASADLARELGAVVIDAQEAVTGYDGDPAELFDEWGLHFSAKGAAVIGRYISDQALVALLDRRAAD